MKKLISLFLTLMLTMSLAGTADTVWQYTDEHPENWIGYTGKIEVYFTHDYSITFRNYTAEDFPKLDIKLLENYWIDPDSDIETLKNNPLFRRRVTITLNDQSEDSLKSAVKYLDSLSYVDNSIATADYYSFGDANCDRARNLNDASYMLKHIAGWENTPVILKVCDMNADKNISLSDVTILLKVIAKWDLDYLY